MASKEKDLFERIAQLEKGEMDDILHAVRKRYAELFPTEDFVLVSIPKEDPKEREVLWKWLGKYVRSNERNID